MASKEPNVFVVGLYLDNRVQLYAPGDFVLGNYHLKEKNGKREFLFVDRDVVFDEREKISDKYGVLIRTDKLIVVEKLFLSKTDIDEVKRDASNYIDSLRTFEGIFFSKIDIGELKKDRSYISSQSSLMGQLELFNKRINELINSSNNLNRYIANR